MGEREVKQWDEFVKLTECELERATLTAKVAVLEAQLAAAYTRLSDVEVAWAGAAQEAVYAREELEQLAAAGEWIPIEPGLHFIEGNNDTALLVSLDGSLLTIHATDDSMHHALSIQLSPKQYRLCRKQGGDA
jgi:hypothetical protein